MGGIYEENNFKCKKRKKSQTVNEMERKKYRLDVFKCKEGKDNKALEDK